MKRFITLPAVLALGILSIIGAGILGMVIVVFELLDRILTPHIRKRNKR